ncbi:hypothetical protein BDR26DRAFT_890910 [Obelidium mucronatum]|nr:hypothetical protein BDR26DRAFT_890910 [Obelidium mucronatum]
MSQVPKVPLATILRETMTNSKRKAPASSEVQPLRPAFVDRLASSVGLGITLAPVPTTPTMSFEEAEAILTSPLCSPNLKPSDSASLLSRPQLCIVDSTQPLDCFTQAASPVNGFPQPESRNSSISSVSSTFSDLSESRSGDMCNGAILSLIAFSQAPQVSTHHQPHHLALSTTTQAPPPQNLIWKPKQGETLRNQLLPSPSKANTTSLLQKAISAAPSVCVPSATQPENEKQRTRLTHEQREYMMRIFEIDH